MKDIKKKFLDILFETVEDEQDDIQEVEEEVVKRPIKEESSIKAKDILYRKSESSAFIDLNDLNKKEENTSKQKKENDYEFASQISPIFGVLKESKRRPIKLDNEVNDAIINKPEDSHLEIITSPIYGYGDQEDLNGNRNMTAGLLADESELHELFDDEQVVESQVEENYENNLESPVYLDEQDYLDSRDYYSEEYDDEPQLDYQDDDMYDDYQNEDYLEDLKDNQDEEETIFTHQRYDLDEGEITLFDTIEDEE